MVPTRIDIRRVKMDNITGFRACPTLKMQEVRNRISMISDIPNENSIRLLVIIVDSRYNASALVGSTGGCE